MSGSVEEIFGGQLATNDSEHAKNIPANYENDTLDESVTDAIDGRQAKYTDHSAAIIAVQATIDKQNSPIESAPTKNENMNKDSSRAC